MIMVKCIKIAEIVMLIEDRIYAGSIVKNSMAPRKVGINRSQTFPFSSLRRD